VVISVDQVRQTQETNLVVKHQVAATVYPDGRRANPC